MVNIVTATRPSTLANTLDDKSGLMKYVAANTLRSVAAHPDLMTRLALIRDKGWKSYQPLYEEADQRGGGREASAGTNIHMVLEAIHGGMDIAMVPEPARSDGQAVFDAIHALGLKVVATEMFLVTQGLPEMSAGTADLILQAPDGTLLIGDTKSVGEDSDGRYSGLKWAIQTGIYAHGAPLLDGPIDRDQWGRPRVDLDAVKPWTVPMSTEVALILQVVRGRAEVKPIWVDAKAGWQWARVACEVRALRSNQKSAFIPAPRWPSE